MWWCQIIDWLKFETRLSSLLNFGTVNLAADIQTACSALCNV